MNTKIPKLTLVATMFTTGLMKAVSCLVLGLSLSMAMTATPVHAGVVDVIQTKLVKLSGNGSTTGCPGTCEGYYVMTDPTSGLVWLTPPPGTTNLFIADMTTNPPPYQSAIVVTRKSDLVNVCGDGQGGFNYPIPNPPVPLGLELCIKKGPAPGAKSVTVTFGAEWQIR